MAKSIRSKWKRKCRAVKRERYGKKELERLKKTLGTDKCKQEDVDMQDIEKLVTVVNSIELLNKSKESNQEGNVMEIDEKKRVFNRRTMRDQNGTFPVWMNQRHIRKQKGKVQKKKTNKIKKKK